MYEVTKERLGSFDVVLFLGVLYHLRHPLLALERVCEVSRGVVAAPSVRLAKRGVNGRNVNALVSERLTDLGGGPTFYSCLVQVEKSGD